MAGDVKEICLLGICMLCCIIIDVKKITTLTLGLILLLGSVLGLVQWIARQHYQTQGWEQGIPESVNNTSYATVQPSISPDLTAPCTNTALESYPDGKLDQVIEWIKQGGFQWIRQRISWSEVEPEPGEYDWSIWDIRIKALTDANIGMVAVLADSPLWAGNPPDEEAYARFAGAFAQRYASEINYYQIWHNMNIGDGWGGYPDAYAYTKLLALSNQAIHAEDSDARIILGSLAPNVESGNKNYAEDIFLDMLYAAGAGDYYDIVSVQPYGFGTGPEDRRVKRTILNFSRSQLIRQTLLQHGEGDKAIWASNFGWNSLPGNWGEVPSIWGSVSEEQQADYTVEALQRAAREWPWMGLMCVNILQPRLEAEELPVPDAEEHWGFALLSPTGERRPVYDAIQAWSGENKGASAGVYPAYSPFAVFEGSWTLGPQGADIGQSGDRVDFNFSGTGLAVTVRRGPYRAFMFAEVDGNPAPALPRDRIGRAYIVLYDPLAATATITLAENLPYGQHTATLVAERGWGQWALADWRVIDAPDNQIYYIGLFIFGVIFCIGAILVNQGRSLIQVSQLFSFLENLWQHATTMIKGIFSVAAGVLYLFAAWHLVIGDGLFRRLGDHGDWIALVLSAGLFYFSHWFLLTLFAGSIVALLVLLRPGLGLALTIFAAPLYLHPLSLFGKSFSLTELVLLPTLVGAGLSYVREHNSYNFKKFWSEIKSKSLMPFIVFAVYGFIVSLSAEFQHVALREWRLVILEPVLFLLALTLIKLRRDERLRILDALVTSALCVAVVGLVQYFWLGDVITAEGGIRRLRSIYGSPNNVGLYLGRVFPILLAVGLGWLQHDGLSAGRMFRNALSRNGLFQRRFWYILAFVPISLALVLSFSRGAIILGIPAAILTLGLFAGKKWRRLTLILLVLGVVALVPLLQLPRFAGLFDLSQGTTGFRISLWFSSMQMIKDFPLLGVGPDNFLYAYRTRYVLPTAWEEFNLSHPHNIMLDFACRLGLPGLALLIWMQVVFWRRVIDKIRSKDIEIHIIALAIAASMADFLAHGLVDAAYFVIDLAYVYMFSIAVVFWLQDWSAQSEAL